MFFGSLMTRLQAVYSHSNCLITSFCISYYYYDDIKPWSKANHWRSLSFFSLFADLASPHSVCGEALPDHHRLSSGHPVPQLQAGSFCGAERKRLPRHLQLTAASSTAWWVSVCLSKICCYPSIFVFVNSLSLVSFSFVQYPTRSSMPSPTTPNRTTNRGRKDGSSSTWGRNLRGWASPATNGSSQTSTETTRWIAGLSVLQLKCPRCGSFGIFLCFFVTSDAASFVCWEVEEEAQGVQFHDVSSVSHNYS